MSAGRGPEDVAAAELAQFQHYVRFVSLNPAKNRRRFYHLSWQVSLDGATALVCRWGRLGTQGRSRVLSLPERLEAQPTLERLIRRRLKRGYQVSEWQ
jgi:predicted DNA-binding WGR domain protein